MSTILPSDYTSTSSPLPLLIKARELYTQKDLAKVLGVTTKTIGRWENGETECPSMVEPALLNFLSSVQRGTLSAETSFSFIDLFAGIGGMRLGFEAAGGKCVFTSEWNDYSKKTYLENHGDGHPFVGDIVKHSAESIPDHDVLLAGFPCQPFSIAGVSKKNALGRPHGFECTTQGTLFFDVARIIAAKQPKAFLLENVKNLLSHDQGNTFKVIIQTLEKELDYTVQAKVIDGQHWVPQHRERILIVGFKKNTGFSWDDFVLPTKKPRLESILHPEDGTEDIEEPFTCGPKAAVHKKYVLSDRLWEYLQNYAKKHKEAGNGFGFGLVTPENVSRTLSARYYKDGSEILVSRGKNRNPRRLTPRECARLMGFPDSFKIPVSDCQAYRQFGNSVIVPVMKHVAKHMVPHIRALQDSEATGFLQQSLFARP